MGYNAYASDFRRGLTHSPLRMLSPVPQELRCQERNLSKETRSRLFMDARGPCGDQIVPLSGLECRLARGRAPFLPAMGSDTSNHALSRLKISKLSLTARCVGA